MLDIFGSFSQAGAVGGCVTIDSTTNDNGFLNCARAANPGSSGHSNIVGAVSNLAACEASGRKPANLIGHGNDGIIVTGTGQNANDPQKYVSLWNQSIWEPQFKRLKNQTSGLSLWACHPGTADAGADFLYHLAQVINANVAGPTGFLYCGNGRMWLEANSIWQVATPTKRPPAVQAPTPHLTLMSDIVISMSGTDHILDFDDIVDANYEHFSVRGGSGKVGGEDARMLAAQVLWDKPFNPGGVPAALVTGRLEIAFKLGEETEQKAFLVYNGRLLQDEQEVDVFYHASTGFALAISQII